MESSQDKQWASKYLLDPLTAPQPNDETGPGSSFASSSANRYPTPPSPAAPKQKSSVHVRQSSGGRSNGYPSPPTSTSPRREQFPHRQEAFANYDDGYPKRRSMDQSETSAPISSRRSMDQSSDGVPASTAGRRRGSSLTSRFPGDHSHRPLDMIRHESNRANRSPHLRKKHIPGADTIDSLDQALGGAYHHEGPYDATLLARNTSFISSPVQAVMSTNEEALKATPQEKIKDSIDKHRPLEGVAAVPPGMEEALSGRTYNYEEGENMMIADGGDYKRWPNVTYLPEDIKGKGEPAYSLEKALKEHKQGSHRRVMSDGGSGIEMSSRPRSSSGADQPRSVSGQMSYTEWEGGMQRNNTTGQKVGEGLKKRFSLRKKT
ncbi:MAG: hypothetical protein M1827_005509 [Pycnora praestabilis]|nr:MAG: hypothetical protein M1827_005509 [Pycnora praestabilis]